MQAVGSGRSRYRVRTLPWEQLNMLHAPTSEIRRQSDSSPTQVAPERRPELGPRLGGSAGSTQQQFASLQRTYGNQAVLRMMGDARSRGPTGDKKKSDDNGGPGVPDGVKQFNPKTPNAQTSGSPVDLSTVEKPQQPDWDNGFDEGVAKRYGATRHISLEDLGTKIAVDPVKETRRIQHLIVGGHGNKDMLATGSGDGPDVSDALNLKESNKNTWLPFFSSGKFYGQAQIWLVSCNVGNGPIPQLIADQSGSIVYAYTRTAYASDPSPFQKPAR